MNFRPPIFIIVKMLDKTSNPCNYQGYSSCYVPTSLTLDMPTPLSDLFKVDCLNRSYYEIAQRTQASVTTAQALAVEEKIRSQSHSCLWHRMRNGRVTASRLKAVCHTDPASPSISLIMSICHLELSRFKSAATTWGCEHENEARKNTR